MRLVYLGTPPAAVPPLQALVSAGHDVVLAVTQPDRRRGRGGDSSPSPVKASAEELGIPVSHAVDDVLTSGAELGVVVAFGKLIKAHVLDVVPMVNVHFSLLPRWRGAAPVERAILAGETETGVCLMALDPGLDTGPVYECRPLAIEPDETAAQLRDRLVVAGTELLVTALDNGLGQATPQSGEPTYAAKIERNDLRLDFSVPASHVLRTVRVGRAWTIFRGKRLVVARASLGSDLDVDLGALSVADGQVLVGCGFGTSLTLIEVRPEGKRSQTAADWANGARLQPGDGLGS